MYTDFLSQVFFSFFSNEVFMGGFVFRISWDNFNCSPDWTEQNVIGGKQFEQLEGQIAPQEELGMLTSLSV